MQDAPEFDFATEAGDPWAPFVGVACVAAAALVLAALGRRRFPVGVSQALFVAGVSGALLAGYAPNQAGPAQSVAVCAFLTGLAVLWHLMRRWLARQQNQAADGAWAQELALRSRIAGHAVVICGVLLAGVTLRLPADLDRQTWMAISLCLMILVGLSVQRLAGGGGGLSQYAMLGLLACALRLAYAPVELLPNPGVLAIGLLAAGVAALVAALVPLLGRWWHRRRLWRTAPHELVVPPPDYRVFWTAVLIVAALVGAGGLLVAESWPTPLAVFAAALAAFIAGHRRQSIPAGELGLVLVGAGIVFMAMAWLPAAPLNPLLGSAVAGGYLLWLARFWHQQLHEGQAWTTAGRLIPAARRLAFAVAVLCAVLAVVAATSADTLGQVGRWQALLAALALLGFWSMLVRDAGGEGGTLGAFAACLVLLAACVPVRALLATVNVPVPWPVLAAGAALVLALRVGRQRGQTEVDSAFNAYIGGFLPAGVLYAVVLSETYGDARFGLVGIAPLAGLLPAVLIRWRPWRRAARGGPVEQP